MFAWTSTKEKSSFNCWFKPQHRLAVWLHRSMLGRLSTFSLLSIAHPLCTAYILWDKWRFLSINVEILLLTCPPAFTWNYHDGRDEITSQAWKCDWLTWNYIWLWSNYPWERRFACMATINHILNVKLYVFLQQGPKTWDHFTASQGAMLDVLICWWCGHFRSARSCFGFHWPSFYSVCQTSVLPP